MTEATVLLMGADNPERSAMVHQTLEKLTVEAKFVLYVLFNTPGELSQLLFGGVLTKRALFRYIRGRKMKLNSIQDAIEDLQKLMKPNKQLVYHYLKALGWPTRDIRRVISELNRFTEELATL